MDIRMVEMENKTTESHVFCDVCKKRIALVGDGSVLWSPGDLTPRAIHNGDECYGTLSKQVDQREQQRGKGGQHIAVDLSWFLVRLGLSLDMDYQATLDEILEYDGADT